MSDNSGLDDLLAQEGAAQQENEHRYYPYHEFEDTAWEWFKELEERFPVSIDCEFIEVSTRMSKYTAKTYYREEGAVCFIRFSKYWVENSPEWRLKQTLLHEMVHLYTYQMGWKEISDSSIMFKWLCGQVGATVNQISQHSEKWEFLAEPFLDEELRK